MDSITDLDLLDKRLAAEAPNKKQRNRECFEAAYALLEKHLFRGVPLATVRDAFNSTYGLNVSPQRFRQLLEWERKRNQGTDVVPGDIVPDDPEHVTRQPEVRNDE